MDVGIEVSVGGTASDGTGDFSATCILALAAAVVDETVAIGALMLAVLLFPFIEALFVCSIISLSFFADDEFVEIGADLSLDLPAYEPTGTEPFGQIHPRLPWQRFKVHDIWFYL